MRYKRVVVCFLSEPESQYELFPSFVLINRIVLFRTTWRSGDVAVGSDFLRGALGHNEQIQVTRRSLRVVKKYCVQLFTSTT